MTKLKSKRLMRRCGFWRGTMGTLEKGPKSSRQTRMSVSSMDQSWVRYGPSSGGGVLQPSMGGGRNSIVCAEREDVKEWSLQISSRVWGYDCSDGGR